MWGDSLMVWIGFGGLVVVNRGEDRVRGGIDGEASVGCRVD